MGARRIVRPDLRLTVELVLFAGCAAVVTAVCTVAPARLGTAVVGVPMAIVAVTWLVLTPRRDWALAAVVVYLGLVDGVLKLGTGSTYATLGRDVVIGAALVGTLLRSGSPKEETKWPPLAAWPLAFVILTVLQLLNPGSGRIVEAVGALRPHLEFVPMFLLGFAVLQSQARLRAGLWLLVAIAAINGLVSYYQFKLTPAELGAWGPGYHDRVFGTDLLSARVFHDDLGVAHTRPFGLGGDLGFSGFLAMLAVPGALALLATAKSRAERAWLIAAAICLVVAVVTSQTRAAIIGTLMAVLAYVVVTSITTRGLRTWAMSLVVLAAAIVSIWTITELASAGSFDKLKSIAPDRIITSSLDYRKGTFAVLPDYIVDYPLGAGIGFVGPGASVRDKLGSYDRRYGLNAENELTYIVIELGIGGLIILLGLAGRVLWLMVTRLKLVEDARTCILLTGLLAPMFGLLVTWFATASSARTPESPYFWLASGVAAYWLVHAVDRRA